MSVGKFRTIFGVLIGFFFAFFGVFLFNGFVYRGISFSQHLLPLMQVQDTFWSGIYQLFGSGLMVDFFSEFSVANIQAKGLGTILFGAAVWPALLSWFMAGFFLGVFVCGAKRSVLRALAIFLLVILLWIVFGMFAETDLTSIFQHNLLITLGEFFTALIMLLPGAALGGSLSSE
jgi:hypothetical protein